MSGHPVADAIRSETERTALDALTVIAVPELVAAARAETAAGRAGWYYDPQHSNVIGLISYATEKALIVLYLGTVADDFEHDTEWELTWGAEQ